MRALEALCPGPGDSWAVRWDDVRQSLDWIERLAETPQDPGHHAEGDVATHTRMAVEVLAALPEWRARPAHERVRLFAAVLLHDIGKPVTTRLGPDGRLTSPGHSRRGAIIARRVLWELGVPVADREYVAALIRHHQLPLWAMMRPTPELELMAIRVSLLARNDDLAMLATADALGRRCVDGAGLVEAVDLFGEYCDDLGILSQPWDFASDHARFRYFRAGGGDPRYAAYDDTTATMTLMSGLPGVGKDTWIAAHASDQPVVSLDALRRLGGIAPTDDQGPVVAEAYALARGHLRARRSFVWNATNISARQRERCIALASDYRARVEIVALEAPREVIQARNGGRPHPVPPRVIERLVDRWEAPDITEAHLVRWY